MVPEVAGSSPVDRPSFYTRCSVSLIEAILLGIVQGITEFFPVSSSGHLILIQHLLGFKDLKNYILFDLICHIGTLGALFTVLHRQIRQALTDSLQRKQLLLATLPLFPLVFLLKPIKALFSEPQLLGYCFLATSLILFIGQKWAPKVKSGTPLKDALFIGLSQALAIVPGISRSGATISTALLRGWEPKNAVYFSFILSIPTVLGGVFLETLKLKDNAPLVDISFTSYLLGAFFAWLIGVFALKILLRIVGTAKFQLFTWYTAIIGIYALFLFN